MTAAPQPAPDQDWRALARRHGLVAALTALHTDTWADTLPVGPTGYAVVPWPVLAAAKTVRTGVGAPPGDPAELATVAVLPAGDGDLVAVHRRPPANTGTAGPAQLAEPAELPAWLLDLARLRLGLSQALLDATVAHLGDRRAGDVPLLLQQLVKGTLADAVTEQLELACRLAGPAAGGLSVAGATDLHHQVTLTDRMLLRLLGASGFLLDGPGRTVHASELLADAWTGGPEPDAWTGAPEPDACMGGPEPDAEPAPAGATAGGTR